MPRDVRQYEGTDRHLRERARQLSPQQLRLEIMNRRPASRRAPVAGSRATAEAAE